MAITLLDGAMGTELLRRGVISKGRAWTAHAVDEHPEIVAAIHREYADAGATVHTANTFRTKRRSVGDAWLYLAQRAVSLARASVPATHRVAGSIAPLEDCYRPDLSPPDSGAEHRELAQALVEADVDLLLCETYAHPREALDAALSALSTGVETWLALTAGPHADLLSIEDAAHGAREAEAAGVHAILVNCTCADRTQPFVDVMRRVTGLPIGAYANAGDVASGLSPSAYVALAREWAAAGATIVGGCCGTTPAHIRELWRALSST